MLTPTASSFIWVAGPKILAGGLQLLLMLALMRHFGQHDFGIISVCLSAVILCDSIVGGATDSGVLRLASLCRGDRERSLEIQLAGVILKFAFVVVIAVPVLLWGRAFSTLLFQTPTGSIYLTTSVGALLATLLLRSAQMQYQIKERFALYGTTDLTNNAFKFGGVALLLLFARPSPEGVLTCYGLGTLVVAGFALFFTDNGLIVAFFALNRLRELASHVKWFVLVSATGTAIARMDLFLVSSLNGVRNAGIYSAAQMVALVPQLIGSYIAVIFSPRIMPMWESGTLRKFYRDFQMGIVCVAAAIFLACFEMLPRIGPALFPESFRHSIPVVVVLLPAGLCAFINFPLTVLLLLFIRPRFLLLLDCISLPLLVAAYFWAIPIWGVMGAAVVTSSSAIVRTVVMQTAAGRMLREPSHPLSAVPPFTRSEENLHVS